MTGNRGNRGNAGNRGEMLSAMSFGLPKSLTDTVERAWGELGHKWLRKFPVTLGAATEKWKLSDIRPFDETNYNFVARAMADGLPMVLKLGVPCDELTNEIAALIAFDGRGAVKLLDFDKELGALLLEDLGPYESWTREKDDDYTEAIANTMLLLWKADSTLTPPRMRAHEKFPTTRQWAGAFERAGDEILRLRSASLRMTSSSLEGDRASCDERLCGLIETACLKWRELEDSAERRVLLHGDLHHANVLLTKNGPRAIDPKGVIGDPAFEVYALLKNPMGIPQAQLCSLAEMRIEIVADITGLDRKRLRDWGFCGAVLSMCWDIEEGLEPNGMDLAESLL